MADKTQNVKTRLSFDGEAEYKAACKEINSTLKVLNSEMKLVTAEYKDNASSVDALKAKQAVLQKTYDEQAKKVKETEAALEKCRKATGDNSEESKKLETQLNYQKAALVKTEQELGKTTDEMEKAEKAADEMGKEIKDSGEQADDAKGKFSGFTSVLSGMGTALKAAAAATAAAVAGAATAIGALTTKAIEGYAAQEQLVGGVETLFKTSSDTVVGYANDAYKTAGMSANEYMETVTSFSASLLASMNNDTAAAAEKANVAITDMSDNANKMGTDISLIQNAYNGFAKQNYTMLDKILKKEVLYEFDLQIECLNPFWREEEETKEDIASWVAAWHFPCVIEKDSTKSMIYGYRAESVIVDCYNEGDVSTGMRIRFTALGTVSNPILLNVDTEEFIQINATMKTGDVIEINTKYGSKGAKLIRDGVETDYFRYIDVDSTFMQLAIGDNMFRYDAASGVNSLEVSIFYSKEFLGV